MYKTRQVLLIINVDNSREFVDKLQNFRKSLPEIMFGAISDIDNLVRDHQIHQILIKEDGTPVTDLDIALSQLLENLSLNEGINFYSEEKIGNWKFPLLVVDPIDGTKEFIAGRDEWVVSVALLNSQRFEGEGWIYNPLKKKIYQKKNTKPFIEKDLYTGEVSRTEWNSGLYQSEFGRFQLHQMGSIAYKLARLAAGEIDFVVSLRPKNIWDIAAGTLLCKEAGLNFYSQGKKIETFLPYFEGPLIWCHERIYSELSSHFY